MKKTLLILSLVIFSSNVFGQEFTGEITYTVDLENFYKTLSEKYKNDPSNYILKINKNLLKIANDFEYGLEFNSHLSKFSIKQGLAVGDMDRHYKMALGLVGRASYFTNLKTNEQLQFKNKVYIKSALNVKWDLTKDTKQIGDYTCYRATAYKQLPKGPVLVTVWYTPQLPLAYGPKEFVGNLPGLVLEYEDNMVHFIANKIRLNTKKALNLTWPKVEGVSSEDYNKEQEKKYKRFKESYGRD